MMLWLFSLLLRVGATDGDRMFDEVADLGKENEGKGRIVEKLESFMLNAFKNWKIYPPIMLLYMCVWSSNERNSLETYIWVLPV